VASSVELFTGCGGLAMGLSQAGFGALRMVEWDRHAVANVLHNRARGVAHVADWPIHLEDVRTVDWTRYAGVDLVAGGPPCQPFSIGGRHRGDEDGRDMWPEAIRAVRETRPAGFLFENVRGLTRAAFSDYLRWVMAALSHPDIAPLPGESRAHHLARLEDSGSGLYRVSLTEVNAADYGAAQKRHRVIFLGLRRDIGPPPPLLPTHTRERLLWDQWVTGEYWRRHDIRPPAYGPDGRDATLVRRLRQEGAKPRGRPWRTVRDAIAGLGEPGSGRYANHLPQPGARVYPGHTGSLLDMPAKALKAGVHGVPGGENTIALPDGGIRYLTVREAARLQGMPDDYAFIGSWSETMRQLGNAVPTELARAAAGALREAIALARPARQAPRVAA
jgi:DNA (cytosine-5)-methyltransferase 1